MGGAIAVTLRTQDGALFKMERWTNAMPLKAIDRRLYLEAEARVEWQQNFLKGWRDYLEVDDAVPLAELPGHRALAPCGYGLLVFDLQANTFWTCNGYTDLQSATALADHDPERDWLFETGRVRLADQDGDDDRFYYHLSDTAVAKADFRKQYWAQSNLTDERLDKYKAAHPGKEPPFDIPYPCLAYDLSPFTCRHYQESESGYRAMLADLQQSFELTPEDLAGWDEFLTERYQKEA